MKLIIVVVEQRLRDDLRLWGIIHCLRLAEEGAVECFGKVLLCRTETGVLF